MYNSQYYTCEQIDERLLQGYLDDYNNENHTSLTKSKFLSKLGNILNLWKGIDDEPHKESDHLISSKGVANTVGYRGESNEYIETILDSDDKILFGIKKDGSIEWGVGVPTPVKEFVEKYVADNFVRFFSGKKVSIIGDSISTFKGYVDSQYSVWYPNYYADRSSDVKEVTDTWWKKLIDGTGAILEVNASSGGSTASDNNIGFYPRVELIGNPDVVIVALGSNDSGLNIPLGNIDYDTEIQSYDTSKFAPAYIKGMKGLISAYPDAKIICVAFDMGESYRDIIKAIAEHYGAYYVYVGDISNVHPSKAEMEAVYKKIYNSIGYIISISRCGKTLIDETYAKGVKYVENPMYSYAILDANDKVLFGIKANGDFYFGTGIQKQLNEIPTNYVLPDDDEVEYIVGTYDTIILKVGKRYPSETENKYLYISDNLGVSWYPPIELPGFDSAVSARDNLAFGLKQIRHTHIFSNGDILLCGRNKCFYLTRDDDYSELHESVIYDYDGEIFDDFELDSFNPETGRIGFYPQMYQDKYFFHKGVELDIFGEYIIEREWWTHTPREAMHPRLWYTTNYGRTIQCAFKTGAPQNGESPDSHGNQRDCSKIDGEYLQIRHFHQVSYCDATNKFYISTGDEDWRTNQASETEDVRTYNEIYFVEADVNFGDGADDKNNTNYVDNQWSFDILCSGYMCKMGNHWFDDKYLYFATDYTQDHYTDNCGIIRCPISELHNIQLPESEYIESVTPPLPKVFRNVYNRPQREWACSAPSFMIMDKEGNAALWGDDGTSGRMWVANRKFDFKCVNLFNSDYTPSSDLIGVDILGPNTKGNVYISAGRFGGTGVKNIKHFNLTNILRDMGVNFFKY